MADTFQSANLRRKRIERGLTLEKIAAKCKVETSTVSRWEQGKMAPRPTHIPKLMKLLNVQYSDLFTPEQTVA